MSNISKLDAETVSAVSIAQSLHNNPFLKDATLQTIYNVYATSTETKNLGSEQNRSIFAEEFLDLNELRVPKLEDLCFQVVAQNFRAGHIDERLGAMQQIQLCEHMSVDLPLMTVLPVEHEHYWKRVFVAKCKDRIFVERKKHEPEINWKSLGVTEKLIEMIENTEYESWNDDEMDKIAAAAAPFVTELRIMKLQSMKEYSIERDPNYLKLKIYHYPAEDCHHGDLKLLGQLQFLRSLTIEFSPHDLELGYHGRFFHFSYFDVENLAAGLKKLEHLKTLKIRRSRMDAKKLDTIIKCVKRKELEELDFYFSQLKDDCGESILELLEENSTLKSLELSGNRLSNEGLHFLAYGIKVFKGKLEYLGLAFNPFGDESVYLLTQGLADSENVTHLRLSGVQVTPEGACLVADLIKNHPPLLEVDVAALPFDEIGGNRLIKALDANRNVERCDFRDGGMSVEQEYKLDILLKRNRYIKANPYLEDSNDQSPGDIQKWTTRIKNPILLNAMNNFEKKQECLHRILDERRSSRKLSSVTASFSSSSSSETDNMRKSGDTVSTSDDVPIVESRLSILSSTFMFKYKPNDFTENEFLRQVQYADPNDFSFFGRKMNKK